MNSQTLSVALRPTMPEAPELDAEEAGRHITRIRRIGKQLFGVANCCVVFGEMVGEFHARQRTRRSVETSFCLGLPLPEKFVLVPDTLADKSLSWHPMVAAPPHIRFYAAFPIRNAENVVIGGICLVDYRPHRMRIETSRLLEDLAKLVEREMHVRTLSRTQLDLQKKNKTLRRKSLIDPLIGTWNRGAIMRILTIEAQRCGKAGVPLSVIVADLDYFKKINDTYGHPVGDAVLINVARRLRSCIRAQEALGRYGGEEFLIVLPGSSIVTAMAVGERMRQAIAAHTEIVNQEPLSLSISAGVASTDLFPAATPEELINYADIALYAAKDGGRDRVVQAVASDI
jgi:diguanylate cyclase (GGDEF)-like protein